MEYDGPRLRADMPVTVYVHDGHVVTIVTSARTGQVIMASVSNEDAVGECDGPHADLARRMVRVYQSR